MQELKINILKDDFQETTATQAYGSVSGATFIVQQGVTITASVKIVVTGRTETSVVEQAKQLARTYKKQAQWNEAMQKRTANAGLRFLWGFFSLCAGGSYEDGYNKKQEKVTEASTQIEKSFYKTINQTLDQNIQVSGILTITGISMIPTTAKVYIEVMQVKTKSGTKKILSGSNPIVANPQTQKQDGITNDKLNLIPL